MTAIDPLDALTAAHNARMAGIDRLIPAAARPAIRTRPDSLPPGYLDTTEEILTVPGAAGIARLDEIDADSLVATWSALTQHRLAAACVGPGQPVAAMAALLDAWQERVGAAPLPPHGESGAIITWPSRDTAMTGQFLDRGLSARVAVAARRSGRSAASGRRPLDAAPPGVTLPDAPPAAAATPADVASTGVASTGVASTGVTRLDNAPPTVAPPGVTIRAIEPRDTDAAVARYLDVIAWDAQFGSMTVRAATPDRAREEITAVVNSPITRAWVAVRDDDVVGFVSIQWPQEAGWISGLVAGDPSRVAYLGMMSVRPGQRGSGIGAALASHVHALLDASGVETTLLHHAVLNPLSTPFWHHMGYRPLWTSWEVRPHTALG